MQDFEQFKHTVPILASKSCDNLNIKLLINLNLTAFFSSILILRRVVKYCAKLISCIKSFLIYLIKQITPDKVSTKYLIDSTLPHHP